MAELKSSEIKYGVPLKTVVGGLTLTATQIEFPASAEYPGEGKLELNREKLGLTDSSVAGTAVVAGESSVGETATTTPLPVFAWCDWITETKTSGEEAKNVTKAWPAKVTNVKGKLFLRIFALVALKKEYIEVTAAEKANGVLGLCGCTVFVLGK